jgi:hypothetical protein
MGYALYDYGRITLYTLGMVAWDCGRHASPIGVDVYATIIKLFQASGVIQTCAITGEGVVAAAASRAKWFKGFYREERVTAACHEEMLNFARRMNPRLHASFHRSNLFSATSGREASSAAERTHGSEEFLGPEGVQPDLIIFDHTPYMGHIPPGYGPHPDPFEVFGEFQAWAAQLTASSIAVWSALAPEGYFVSPMQGYSPEWQMEESLHWAMEGQGAHFIGTITYGPPGGEEGRPLHVWKKSPSGAFTNPPIHPEKHGQK